MLNLVVYLFLMQWYRDIEFDRLGISIQHVLKELQELETGKDGLKDKCVYWCVNIEVYLALLHV